MSCYNVYYIDLTLLFTLIRRIKKELVVHCQMLQLPVESVPITTKVVSFNPVHGKVYSIQHYVIKFVSDLWQVNSFLWVLRFPPPIKTDRHDITEILLKVALSSINQTINYVFHCNNFCTVTSCCEINVFLLIGNLSISLASM
jgi:hypothetical protein